jgi:hypothetical protein
MSRYQYMVIGTNLGEPRKARRWGTREAIEGPKGLRRNTRRHRRRDRRLGRRFNRAHRVRLRPPRPGLPSLLNCRDDGQEAIIAVREQHSPIGQFYLIGNHEAQACTPRATELTWVVLRAQGA